MWNFHELCRGEFVVSDVNLVFKVDVKSRSVSVIAMLLFIGVPTRGAISAMLEDRMTLRSP